MSVRERRWSYNFAATDDLHLTIGVTARISMDHDHIASLEVDQPHLGHVTPGRTRDCDPARTVIERGTVIWPWISIELSATSMTSRQSAGVGVWYR
jgi:hypothetical protein